MAHQFIADGHTKEALAAYQQGLEELKKCKMGKDSRLAFMIESSGAYLIADKPEEALVRYRQISSEVVPLWVKRACLAGEGFAYLKLGQFDEARNSFQSASKINDSTPDTFVHQFPVDLCPQCVDWGMQAASDHRIETQLDPKLFGTCLSSRLLIAAKLNGKPATTSSAAPKTDDLQTRWERLMRGGRRCEREHDNKKAIRFFTQAIDLLRANKDEGLRLQKSLQALGFHYAVRGNRIKALPLLEEELALQRRRFGSHDRALIAPLARIASVELNLDELEQCERHLNEARQLTESAASLPKSEQIYLAGVVASHFAELRFAQLRLVESCREAQTAIDLLAQSDRPKINNRLIPVYLRLSAAQAALNHIEEAAVAADKSYKLMDQWTDPRMTLKVSVQCAELRIKKNNFSQAREAMALGSAALRKMEPLSKKDKDANDLKQRLTQCTEILKQ